jgi:AraC-like DNA-binding protein
MDVMKAAEQHIATRFNRIERVLAYIHANLDQPLNVADLAALSCWSRWQLQRVFSEQTGLNVAHYVRELKLGQAAQQLVMGQSRVIDIALMYGFGSEASFSRALPETLKAFIYHWLPQSGYTCTDGVELEVYPPHYQPADKHAVMHYWVPLDIAHIAPN